MRRFIYILLCLSLLLSYLLIPAYAATSYVPDSIFVGLIEPGDPLAQVSYIFRRTQDNNLDGNMGTVDLGYVDTEHFFIGASYPPAKFDSNSLYTFAFAVHVAPIVTMPDIITPVLYSTYTDSSEAYLLYSLRYLLSSSPSHYEWDGENYFHIFKFENIPAEEMFKYLTYFIEFESDDFEADYLYLLGMTIELTGHYSDELFAQKVDENLGEIKSQLQANGEKLDDIVSQNQEHHDEEMSQAEEQHEETKGLLSSIISGITSIPDKIKNVFKNLFDEIIGSVKDSISNSMNSFLDDLTDKLGILYQAPDYFVKILESIMTTEKSNELTFPSMVVPVAGEEYTLNEPLKYQIFPDWIPAPVYSFINLAFSIVVIIAVINFADRKWEEITTNG